MDRKPNTKGGEQMNCRKRLELTDKYLNGKKRPYMTERILTIVFVLACVGSIVIALLLMQ